MLKTAQFAFECAFASNEHHLQPKNFVKSQAPTCCVASHKRFGHVNVSKCGTTSDETKARNDGLGQCFGKTASNAAIERLFHPCRNVPSKNANLFTLGIDRHDLARAITDQVNNRIRHLQISVAHLWFSKYRHLHPWLQLLRAPWLIKKSDRQFA